MEVRMTRIITYSLRQDEENSNEYYRDITTFTDTWLAGAVPESRHLLAGFRAYRLAQGDIDRSDAEYTFELLVLGVLWREHGGEAAALPGWAVRLLDNLLKAQNRWPRREKYFKTLRGWVSWLARRHKGRGAGNVSLQNLLIWLHANGEDGCADRLAEWQAYLDICAPSTVQTLASHCQRLAEDFATGSQDALGGYTQAVARFLSETAPWYRRRYDARLISSSRLEYHLGMLGTELLNRAYRQQFLSARHKVVILPPCMRAQPDSDCKAMATPFGAKCQACTPTCRIHQITRLGEKRGFDVFMIPDELRIFGGGQGNTGLGVVGVSCVLTNWSGGWDTQRLGIPAQGLLLDYVGCSYHWDEHGIPTDTNLHQLLEVLGFSEQPAPATPTAQYTPARGAS
jgi:hypothetical protein